MNKLVNKFWAVVPAAGIGCRMRADRPKQYLLMAGRPLIEHTLTRLCDDPRINRTVVALADDDTWWDQCSFASDERVMTTRGGEDRAHSVRNGLLALRELASADDWVLVHDAARPCLSKVDMDSLIATTQLDIAGALLALPLTDTIKRAADDGKVLETLDRSTLWRACTPQMFRFEALLDALEDAIASGVPVTDEAAAMERMGAQPMVVPCDPANIKVTGPADLALAEFWLGQNTP